MHRIFVVDGDRSVAMTLVRILTHGGYDATPFTDSTEALLAANLNAPRLVLADANMPSISGIDLAVEVRQCAPDCQVLLMSGALTQIDLLGPRKACGFEFEVLEKPLGIGDLLGKVQCLIGEGKPA